MRKKKAFAIGKYYFYCAPMEKAYIVVFYSWKHVAFFLKENKAIRFLFVSKEAVLGDGEHTTTF